MLEENKKIAEEILIKRSLGKSITGKRQKPIIDISQKRYISCFKIYDAYFNKSFRDITSEDIDRFRTDLRNGKVRKYNGKTKKYDGKPYESKKAVEKMLKPLLHFIGKPELANYLSNYSEEDSKEIEALSKDEVHSIVSSSKLRDKLIVQVLFDGGFRAAEFLNIKFADLKDDSLKSDGYYKIRITKSKTEKRTVALLMPESTQVIKDWLALNKDKIGTSQSLVPVSYDHLNKIIKRLGKNVLKKKLTPHILRHSSATYYCRTMSQYPLCKRFGWQMGSGMPQRYIDAQGLDVEVANKNAKLEEDLTLQKEINKLKEQLALKNEELKAISDKQEAYSKKMDKLTEMLTPDNIKKLLKVYDKIEKAKK